MAKKMIGRGLFVATAGITGLATYRINTDEGSYRSYSFWKQIFPIFMHYRYYQLLNRDLGIMSDEEADKNFNELHEKYANRVRDITYTMRGFYLKQAQLLSTQDDFVPPQYMKWVKDTQDNVPSEFPNPEDAKNYCKKILKDELNLEFDEIFEEWDDTPLGIASIGQVHKAKLRENGKTVAVKLLIPGMENKFRSDIRTTKDFCRLAMPQHVSAMDEIEKQFCSEFDYSQEAKNLNEIYHLMLEKWSGSIEIPKPYLNYCSKHMLTMDYLNGIKLVDGIRRQYEKLAKLSGKSLEDIENEKKIAIKQGEFQLKTLSEKQQEQKQIQNALFLNDCLNPSNMQAFLYNYSGLGWVFGPMEYQWSEPPVDLGSCIDLLCQVHGNQIFEHGIFNGDPHPGNILLLENGKLGLIDYGQVKRITLEQRIIYAKLILAHARGDKDEIVRLHFDELGTVTKYRKPDIAYLSSTFYNDRDTPDISQGRNIAELSDYLESQDPMISLPEDFLFLCRVNILLRGMGKAFGIQFRMSKQWEKEAQELLDAYGINPLDQTSRYSNVNKDALINGQKQVLQESLKLINQN